MLGFTVKLALLVYFVFTVLFLLLRYVVLPNIDYYKPDIERAASRALGNQVTIARLYASWSGLNPSLFLGDVTLRDRQGRVVLALPSVSATVSWLSVVTAEPRFRSLELIRPELDMRRTPDGALYVAGVKLAPGPGGGGGPDWLFRQHEVVIRQGKLHWTDEQRGAPELALSDVTLVLANHWNTHRFGFKATPPLGQPLDLRARFTHPALAKPSDALRWKGELYADLRDTDLAAWKQYIDIPFELNQGKGSVRAWMNVDHARLASFTADVALSGVSARLRPDLARLELAAVSGRLAASETLAPGKTDDKPTFGANGYDVSVSDFTVATRDGVLLPPATVSESWRPASRVSPEHTQVTARQVDLAALATLAADLPLHPEQREMLADFAPRGLLQDVAAEWDGRYPALASYRVHGRVAGLSLRPQAARAARPASGQQPAQAARAALPGFDNLSGIVDASDNGGSVQLDSTALVLHMPAWFAEPDMPFDKLSLQVRWSHPRKDQLLVEVDGMNAEQGTLRLALSGRQLVPLAGGGPGNADFTGTIDGFQINQVGRFLPKITPESLHGWLTGALQGGTLRDGTLRLRGDLAHFPFRADNAAARAAGEFRVAGKLDQATLEYAPGHHAADGKAPLWPLAEQINGSIVFDRARMEIKGDTLRTMGVALSNVKAVIPDLAAHELMLDIEGSGNAPMQEYLRYMAASPVLEWIGNFTEDTHATGNARLGLKLHMPLDHLPDTKVQGGLQLLSNDVALFPELPPLTGSIGRIEFNERGFNLAGVGGNFLGAPLAVSGGTQRDGAIVVRLAGTLSGEGMRRSAPEPALQRLGRHLSGTTRYSGAVVVRDRQHTVILDSNLAGLGMELPAPLNKAAADALPLHFVLAGGPANDNGVARDEIRIGLGGNIAARYLRERQHRGGWNLLRGGIGVNAPAPEPDSGMLLNINTKSLNLDQWLALGSELAGPESNAAPASAASSAAGLAQYTVPDALAVRTSELVFDDRKLGDVVLGASHQKGSWQASIHARQAVGYLTWDEAPSGGVGKVSARLASLVIPESAANEVKDLLAPDKPRTSTIPSLDIVVDQFELFNKKFGRLELAASNVMAAGGREWRIDRLSVANPDGALKATGRWTTTRDTSNTAMNFNLDIRDAGKLLDRLGFPETLRNGKGNLSGDIAWSGLPYSLDIPSLSGKIQMKVEDGQFLKQDPGAAKLLGVLSLQALPRLLKFDFHDVFAEGLAFDGITANATISRGVVKTDNLKMHGVAATVLMDGTADIANESTNLHVVVIPEFNLGTGPLVYGLAVNPVIGLGSYLAQLFLRAPMMKALTYQLQVSGPWKAPVITRLDHNNVQPPQQAKAKDTP
ncbi:YhdP family protein [Massilia terrae]|uniref:YhdP family protein n=1 Tax=Massilia terrae TaxID=1811224 RepID=UPI0027D99F4B|nr:YhdP family protein [Massilia terrae]